MIAMLARRFAALSLLVLGAPAALAHEEGHGAHDFGTGLLHPFAGIDHLLAMVAVGLWAAHLGKKAMWSLPMAFAVSMLCGALLAIAGVALPAIESMIAISVIVVGLFVAGGVRMNLPASAAFVTAFAIFHGYAHASEAPSGHMGAYAAGFVLATLALHGVGIAVGLKLRGHAANLTSTRFAGSAIAVAGSAILLL